MSKKDPIWWHNISVNFEIYMLPVQMKGSLAIQNLKKKKKFISLLSRGECLWQYTDVNSCSQTSPLMTHWQLKLPIATFTNWGNVSACAQRTWSHSPHSYRLPERGDDKIAPMLMDVRAILTLQRAGSLSPLKRAFALVWIRAVTLAVPWGVARQR